VGSVNWIIKQLISRGYLKVSQMDHTRLHYYLNLEGMAALTHRATQHMKDSLQVYKELREFTKTMIAKLKHEGTGNVSLKEVNEFMDKFRLSCIEARIRLAYEATA